MIVRMRVECARCGHHEDETYEFDMPVDQAQPNESEEPGKCPGCGALLRIQLKQMQRVF